jgi:ribosomal protein L37E
MGWGVPSWVERDFRSCLRCGILAHGFARLRCTDCGHERQPDGYSPCTIQPHAMGAPPGQDLRSAPSRSAPPGAQRLSRSRSSSG